RLGHDARHRRSVDPQPVGSRRRRDGVRHVPEQPSGPHRNGPGLHAMLTPRGRRGRRAGFTIIELLISMVLMSLVAAAIVQLLLRQERFYNSTTDLIQTRQQIRQAAAMLPADLRGISSVGGDIYVMSDSALEFRSVFGSSVVCA